MLPDPDLHNPDHEYLRKLLRRIKSSRGWSHSQVAEMLKMPRRTLENYLSPKTKRPAPYAVQYALEVLAVIAEERNSTLGVATLPNKMGNL